MARMPTIDSAAKTPLSLSLHPFRDKPQPSTTDLNMITSLIASSLPSVAAAFSA